MDVAFSRLTCMPACLAIISIFGFLIIGSVSSIRFGMELWRKIMANVGVRTFSKCYLVYTVLVCSPVNLLTEKLTGPSWIPNELSVRMNCL
jgi:hypothetical protein